MTPSRAVSRGLFTWTFLASLAVYVMALAPSVYWLDSSELAAAAFGLGIAHPPGHPLAALLGKAATLLPIGSVALRVGFASALMGAFATARTAQLGELVASEAGSGVAALLGAAAGALFGLSYAAAFQAVRPEVYALSTALVLSAVLEIARFDETADRRRLASGAIYAGLALSNHHLLALVVLLPSFGLLMLFRPRPRLRDLCCIAALSALGLLVWIYLPLRAARHPLVDWGAPLSLERVSWVIRAQAFQKSLAHGSVSHGPAVVLALAEQLSPLGLLLSLAGVYVLVRRGAIRLGALFLLGALADAAAPALVGFDRANPDAYGYLEAAVALLCALATALPAALFSRSRRFATSLAGVLLVAAVAFGLGHFDQFSLADDYNAAALLGGWLRSAPAAATLVTSDFQTVFGLYYLQGVEAQRPDVDSVHRHFLAYPGYRDEIVRRTPALAPLLGERDLNAEAVLAAAAVEPVLLQYDFDLASALVALSTTVPIPRLDLGEPQLRRFVGWQSFLAVQRACRLGEAARFAAAFAEARHLLGEQPELEQLRERCGGILRSGEQP